MSFMIILLLLNIRSLISSSKYSNWIVPSDPQLPRECQRSAIGYSNKTNTIWILGGLPWPHRSQLVSFHIINNTFIDHGLSNLSIDVYGRSQYFKQIDQLLYMSTPPNKLNVFNLETGIFMPEFQLSINDEMAYSCYTSINDEMSHNYLVLLGGGNIINTNTIFQNMTQILNISSNVWLNNLPSMQRGRGRFTCQVYNNEIMYAIGGISNDLINNSLLINLYSIEILSVNNLHNISKQHWYFINSTLPIPMSRIISTVFEENKILIIGGLTDNDIIINYVTIINMETNQVTIGGYLDTVINDPAAITVNNIVYVFGGADTRAAPKEIITWRYNDLSPTFSPTITPSIHPTLPPSRAPSIAPSIFPTDIPTVAPSNAPSNVPSIDPSKPPSFYPSFAPSSFPSKLPTILNTLKVTEHSPTIIQTNISLMDETNTETITAPKTTSIDLISQNNGKHDTIIIIIIILCITLVCIAIFSAFMGLYKTNKRKKQNQTEIRISELNQTKVNKHDINSQIIEMGTGGTLNSAINDYGSDDDMNVVNDIEIDTPGDDIDTAMDTAQLNLPGELTLNNTFSMDSVEAEQMYDDIDDTPDDINIMSVLDGSNSTTHMTNNHP